MPILAATKALEFIQKQIGDTENVDKVKVINNLMRRQSLIESISGIYSSCSISFLQEVRELG